MTYKIIDVSKYQKDIDFSLVKGEVDGVIVRAGYRGYGDGSLVEDPFALKNIQGCIDRGIPYGAYFLTQAKNREEGKEEAEWLVNFIRDNFPDNPPLLPLFADSENSNGYPYGRADNISVTERTSALKAFCGKLEEEGYFAGIYASTNRFDTKVDDIGLLPYAHWVAHYAASCGYEGRKVMWQYTSTGRVKGITGNVDISEGYMDFPRVIKAKGLNGYIPDKTEGTGENDSAGTTHFPETDSNRDSAPGENDSTGTSNSTRVDENYNTQPGENDSAGTSLSTQVEHLKIRIRKIYEIRKGRLAND